MTHVDDGPSTHARPHAYHETLPGYDPDRLLQDGCEECERRGADPLEALVHLDGHRFARAWKRAAEWQRDRLDPRRPVSVAEAPMLRTIWTIELLFERFGIAPLGEVPRRPPIPEHLAGPIMHLRRNTSDPTSDLSTRLTELERRTIIATIDLLGLFSVLTAVGPEEDLAPEEERS